MADLTPPAEPLVHLHGVGLSRSGKTLLEDIHLSVRSGEIVTLIGPNGAGKSTLVSILLRLIDADHGRVHHQRGLSIGYVPQKVTFLATLPLTVRRFLGLGRRRPLRDPHDTLAEVGAADLLEAPLHALSGGETRRVLLARAMLGHPRLLVLDEPAAGMDLNGQADLYRLIRTLRQRHHCAVLLVSHDLFTVMAATDRVLCLNRHMCCSGKPEDVRRHPEFRALFGPHPELAPYYHHHDHQHDLHGEIRPAAPNGNG